MTPMATSGQARVLVLAAASVWLAFPSHGQAILETNVPSVTLVWDTQQAGSGFANNGRATFPQFDPSMGTLVGVGLSYMILLDASYTGRNTTGGFISGTATLSSRVSIGSPGLSIDLPSRFTTHAQSADFFAGPYGNVGPVVLGNLLVISGDASVTSPADLVRYSGLGNLSITNAFVAMDQVVPVSAERAMNDRVDFRLSITETLTYRYRPVPEASTPLLLGLGVVVTCWIARPWRPAGREESKGLVGGTR